jgi:hypothetical protein
MERPVYAQPLLSYPKENTVFIFIRQGICEERAVQGPVSIFM